MEPQTVPDPRPKCASCGRRIDDYTTAEWTHERRYGKTVYVANDGTVAHVTCPTDLMSAEETG